MSGRIFMSLFLFSLFSIMSPSWGVAWAEEFPKKPIEFILPYAPGGASDTIGRSLVPKLGEVLGQPVIPINKPGAAGILGMTLVAKAKADGYTILIATTSALTVVPNFEKVEFTPVADFTFLCKLLNQSPMVVVRTDAPWKSFDEFLDFAKKNPKKVKYGTQGQFSGGHIAMEAIAREKGIEWDQVPFKGDGPTVTALLGGHLYAATIAAGHVPLVRTGKLRGLVMMQSYRSRAFPLIPCFKDAGIKFDAKGSTETISGIVAPKGLPNDIIKKYEEAFNQAVKGKEFLRGCDILGLDPHFLPGDDFRKEVEEGYKNVAELSKKLGFK